MKSSKKRAKKKQLAANPDQRAAFIEAARKAGCSEDESVFDENLKKIARHKPPHDSSPPRTKPVKTEKLGR
jgi:hypothetical protein